MADDGTREVYRSTMARLGSYVWFALAAVNLVDIGVRGSGQSGRVAFTVVIAVSVLVYLVAFRPAVVVGRSGVVLRNVLRDVTVPWAAVTEVDATDALRVHAGGRVYRSWAVQAPNRERARASRGARRVRGESGSASDDVRESVAGRTHADFVADQVKQAKERFGDGDEPRDVPAAGPGEAEGADAAGGPDPAGRDPYRRWNTGGAVSLAVATVLVLVAAALP